MWGGMATVLGFELDDKDRHLVDLGGGISVDLCRKDGGTLVGAWLQQDGLGEVYIVAVGPDEMTAQMRLLDRLVFVRDAIDALLQSKPEGTK